MTFDDRFTWGFVLEVIDVLERHGYRRHNNQHTGQAVAVIGDLAQVYDGTRDAPYGTYSPPGPHAEPAQSNPSPAGSITLTNAEVNTLLAALDTAADYQRDGAAVCAECTDQSCSTCHSRLRHARAYDQIATQMSQTRDTWTASLDHPEPADRPPPPSQPQTAADKEAGQ